jgi:chemotaxis protein methyltransferase CheR
VKENEHNQRSAEDLHIEDLELELLLEALVRRWGYDFRNYSRASLRRRVRRALEVEGLASISSLQHILIRDSEAMQRFVYTLAVHVTAMFRDPPFYRAVREQILPLLRTYPFVRIWHAGCSTGEEVYSLAILLHEAGIYDRTRIYATDLSDELLHRARGGVYPLRAMREYQANYAAAGGQADLSNYYLSDGERAIVRRDLRRNLVFSQHNLASDGSFNEFHVVFCRNVMIYFDDSLKDRVQRLLHDSLTRFGILALGMKETLRYGLYEDRFAAIDEAVRIYRRKA